MDIVIEFYTKYDAFSRIFAKGNRKSIRNLESLIKMDNLLETLILVMENRRLEELDKSTVYNTLLIIKAILNRTSETFYYNSNVRGALAKRIEEKLKIIEEYQKLPENNRNRH